jgi:hypothetical protein
MTPVFDWANFRQMSCFYHEQFCENYKKAQSVGRFSTEKVM